MSLIKLIFVIAILLVLSFVADAFVVSRLNFPPTLTTFTTALLLLMCSLLLLKYTDAPLVLSDFQIPSVGWFGVFLCIIFSLILFKISGSILSGKIGAINIEKVCVTESFDYFKAARSIILSPAFETVLFVKILPTFYFRKHPNSSPFWVFLAVGVFFSLMHFRFSPIGIGGTLLAGIVFCYVYYGTGSLLASFLVHASLNAMLLLLDKLCRQTTEVFLHINDFGLYLLAATAIAVIFSSIYMLNRRIQFHKPA